MDGEKSMSKYDKMIALNKRVSDEKIAKARKEICRMIADGEKVTIPRLMQKLYWRSCYEKQSRNATTAALDSTKRK